MERKRWTQDAGLEVQRLELESLSQGRRGAEDSPDSIPGPRTVGNG